MLWIQTTGTGLMCPFHRTKPMFGNTLPFKEFTVVFMARVAAFLLICLLQHFAALSCVVKEKPRRCCRSDGENQTKNQTKNKPIYSEKSIRFISFYSPVSGKAL
jgi:hypothetical protein